MNREDVQSLDHGLYRIHWKESEGGGTSLAVVGSMHSGARWFACANWTGEDGCGIPGSDNVESWDKIERVELIEKVNTETQEIIGPLTFRQMVNQKVSAHWYEGPNIDLPFAPYPGLIIGSLTVRHVALFQFRDIDEGPAHMIEYEPVGEEQADILVEKHYWERNNYED